MIDPNERTAWRVLQPVKCKGCALRMADATLPSGNVLGGWMKGLCEKYPEYPGKPYDIMAKNATCPYWTPEE